MENESSIDGGSEPSGVSMPPEGAFLSGDVKSVGITLSGSNWALGYRFRSVRPSTQKLKNSMPVLTKYLLFSCNQLFLMILKI